MKLAKLSRRLGELLSPERRHRRERLDALKTLLKKMKAQRSEIKQALAVEHDPGKRAGLELKLQILLEQHRKGLRLRKELRRKD